MLEESQAHPDAGGRLAFLPPPLDPVVSRVLPDQHLEVVGTLPGLDLQRTRTTPQDTPMGSHRAYVSKAVSGMQDVSAPASWVAGMALGIGKSCHSESSPLEKGCSRTSRHQCSQSLSSSFPFLHKMPSCGVFKHSAK